MSHRRRPTDLAEKLRANATALEAVIATGRAPLPLLRSLAADLRDFAAQADDYEEARMLLSLLAE